MASRILKVGGITPFSATDYPGKFAFVVFVQGCPWRCHYCHNPHLQARSPASSHVWSDVLAILKRRVGLIDAVVFSGGEPTMDPALINAIDEVRQLGFLIGLHTACIYPRQLEQVLPLLDWIGFDVKAPFALYPNITGVEGSAHQTKACTEMIVASGVDHECRTTIHPSLLPDEALADLAISLSKMGVKNYALQVFRPMGCRDNFLKKTSLQNYPNEALLQKISPLFFTFLVRQAD
jgi:pyruvate formate lyase activating enzyme